MSLSELDKIWRCVEVSRINFPRSRASILLLCSVIILGFTARLTPIRQGYRMLGRILLRKLRADSYANFAGLSAHRVPGRDYRIVLKDRKSPINGHKALARRASVMKYMLVGVLFGISFLGCRTTIVSEAEDSPQFFPIGLTAVDDYYPRDERDPPSKMTVIEELPEISKAGFNVIHSYRFEVADPEWGNTNENAKIFLDACHKSGLKMIMGLHFSWIDPGDLNAIRARVRALKNHPALYAWRLYDDLPQGAESPSVAKLLSARRAIKEIDPIHPLTVSVPGKVDENYEFRDVADIYMPDNMPIGFERIPPGIPKEWESHPEDVGKLIDFIYRAVGPKKKVIAEIQTYNLANDSLSWGDETNRMPQNLGRYPTRAEMRFMAYNALIHNSHGVFFLEYRHHYLNYGRDDGVGGSDTSPRGNPRQWQIMASVATELKSMAPIFLAPDANKKIGVKPESAGIEFLLKDYKDRLYLIAANPSKKKKTATFTMSQPVTAIKVLNEARSITLKGGSFTDPFDVYDVHFYEISSAAGK